MVASPLGEILTYQLFSQISRIILYKSKIACNNRKYFLNRKNICILSEKKVEILTKVSYNGYVKLK